MADTSDLAVLAASAYYTQRNDANRIYAPSSWSLLDRTHDQPSGFEAVAYRKGDEIVIAFAGTDQWKDWLTNFVLFASPWAAAQLEKAAAFYAGIRQQYGEGVTYSFTGHSLGGGLAALMGVLFDQKAVTFDQAPFRLSANNDVRTSIRNYLSSQSLLLPSLATALDSFTSDMAANGEGASVTPGIRGEWKVSDHSVAGEALTSNRLVPTLAAHRRPAGNHPPRRPGRQRRRPALHCAARRHENRARLCKGGGDATQPDSADLRFKLVQVCSDRLENQLHGTSVASANRHWRSAW